MPIIPMVLVNGSRGIGTGWSTVIPQYDPRDLVQALFKKLDGQEIGQLKPWFKVIDN
jgi:DNA topoisomerase-2